jgi:predicted SnoaL-like aldol condensation-catalyzing enzyme
VPETCDEKINAPIVAVLADGDLVTVVTVASPKDANGRLRVRRCVQ